MISPLLPPVFRLTPYARRTELQIFIEFGDLFLWRVKVEWLPFCRVLHNLGFKDLFYWCFLWTSLLAFFNLVVY